ncbi:uncharacterized protein BKA55DRAFT_598158 [Fusarium redolens]|uniref:Uncharacterized protein n=1 Tax=Fusarium redolens TaxID=48865 RepID=A0A9P9G6L4_FUSRE|nr:uncharacterized protein BKA55DRAFT_598158 [Fusarium redolens]KAH7233974.1 hypothetical protein BKA55DRAFT_598158 [Fusarium redolens]
MTLDKKTTKRENMPNRDEANDSMDDAMRNATTQRTELPSDMPQLGGTWEEENNETTAKLFCTPSSSPLRHLRHQTLLHALWILRTTKLVEHRSRRAEAQREIQAIAESLKTTTITQACTTVQNTDQPKPLSSLKDPLPHDEKDNSSSSFPRRSPVLLDRRIQMKAPG